MSSLKYDVNFEELSEDGIRYRVAKEKDFDKCIDLWYEVFQKDAPCTVLGSLPRHPSITQTVTGFLSEGVSILAEDTDIEGHKPVGIGVNYVADRDETMKQSEANGRADVDNLGDLPWAWSCIEALSDRICHPQDIFDRYPDVNKIFYSFSFGTHPDYRQNGIAGKLAGISCKVARSIGCSGWLAFTTSDYSKMIADKIGMEVVSETPWDLVDIGGGTFPWRGKKVGSKAVCTVFMKI